MFYSALKLHLGQLYINTVHTVVKLLIMLIIDISCAILKEKKPILALKIRPKFN